MRDSFEKQSLDEEHQNYLAKARENIVNQERQKRYHERMKAVRIKEGWVPGARKRVSDY